jgi:hypothetical protein
MNTISIPRSNPIRFVRYDTYGTDKPTIDNLFHYDQRFTKTWTKNNYVQKFNTGDPVEIQITTNYETPTLAVYDFDYTLVEAITPTTKLTYDDNKTRVLHYSIDTALYAGKYYIVLDLEGLGRPTLQYISEWFSVNDYSDLTYIQWYGSDTDGILWDASITMGFRIEAFWANPVVGATIEEADDYNLTPIVLRGQNTRQVTFKTSPIPQFIAEKLALATAHESFYINDLEFAAKERSEQEHDEGSGLVIFTQTLYDKSYENYTTFVNEPTPPDEHVNWTYTSDDNDKVTFTTTVTDVIWIY